MFRVDRSLELDGYKTSLSPYRLTDGDLDLRGGPKKYQFVDTPGGAGGVLLEPPKRDTIERPLSLYVYPRFTAAHTNQCTNPRPSGTTGWSAEGAGGTVMTDKTEEADPCIEFFTTGLAQEGGKFTFDATAEEWSGGMWVLADEGAPLKIRFDGEAETDFDATGDWQHVKTEGKTLTADPRSIQVLQRDTTSRVIKMRRCMLYIGATIPLDRDQRSAYWDGTSGDAEWTGDADASTSTTLIGADAMYHAMGVVAEKFDKAEAFAEVDGVTIVQRPYSSNYTNEAVLIGGEIAKAPLDHYLATAQRAQIDLKLYLRPEILGDEVLAGTLYKPAGCPLCDGFVTAGGQIPGPARLEISTPDATDQQLLVGGMQFRNANSSISALITRGGSLDVTELSGTITAGINEVQRITRSGTLSGGTGTFTLHGLTTSTITHSSDAATIQAVLEAHPYIGAGNVTVTGGPLSTTNVDITFIGKLAASNMTQLTWNNSLTGGGSATLSTVTVGMPGYAAANMVDAWTTICGTGNLSDVGDYRIVARVHDAATADQAGNSRLRLMWSIGEGGPVVRNTRDIGIPSAVGTECLVPLGVVSIPPAKQGTQRAKIWVEGRTEGTAGSEMRVVEIMRVPVGVSDWELASPATGTRTLTAYENFGATSGPLTADSATVGGAWAHIGGVSDGTDFTETAAPDNAVIRTKVSDNATDIRRGRGVLLGSATPSNVVIGVDADASVPSLAWQGLIGHGVDNDNFFTALWRKGLGASCEAIVFRVVGGAIQNLAYEFPSASGRLELSMFATGVWEFRIGEVLVASGIDSNLATGGALDDGKSGIIDWQTSATANTRTYRNFTVHALPAPNVVIPASSKKLIIHPDGSAQRESATGVYGELNSVIPNPPRLGPKGNASQTNRIAALISANNWATGSDPTSSALKVDVYHRPAFEVQQGAA